MLNTDNASENLPLHESKRLCSGIPTHGRVSGSYCRMLSVKQSFALVIGWISTGLEVMHNMALLWYGTFAFSHRRGHWMWLRLSFGCILSEQLSAAATP